MSTDKPTYEDLLEKISKLEAENNLLKSQKEILQTNADLIVWGTNTAVWEWDYPSGVVKFSDKKAEMLGYKPEELKQDVNAFTMMIHPQDYEYAMENMRNHLQGKTDVYEVEYRIQAKNGEWKWFFDKGIVKERAPNGKPLKIVGIVNDITDKKNALIQIITDKEKAEESDGLKTMFLNNISNEIRTPLNSISGFSDVISKLNQRSEKLTKYSQIISSNSNKLIEKVTDIIDISQIYSKQTDIKKQSFDFIPFIHDIYYSYLENFDSKEIKYSIDIKPTAPMQFIVVSDQLKLFKIVANLLDNAAKFTHRGEVKLTVLLTNVSIQLQLSDTGIGIADEMKELIFKPFSQIAAENNRKFGANRLGLAIVRSYVQLLGGTIAIETEINKGTTFDIKIPIEIGEEVLVKKNRLRINKSQADTILIVEDQYDNYLYLAEIVSSLCVCILHAKDGEQAVELCRTIPEIDLVLMDVKLPTTDGYTATKNIKLFRPQLPIIAQTAYGLQNDIEKMNESGFDDYVLKPIKYDLLVDKIKQFFS